MSAMAKKHPYHILNPSPWPMLASLAAFVAVVGGVLYSHGHPIWLFVIGMASLIGVAFAWWRDVISESKVDHTNEVRLGLRYGMILFIISEVMFFAAFFWAYFHASLFPTEATGFAWPPKGVETLDPFDLPYLNTLILLLSGTTVTWAHHSLIAGKVDDAIKKTGYTVLLGLIFTCLQIFEYNHATFGFKDGIYSSNFYMATGFHGAHVIIGTIFLAVCYFRMKKKHFTAEDHFGFEAAAWYWHFVDVVWLFLFVAIYLLGS